ncbi:Vacuolar protein 14 C-terminal Fig4p binding family protein [Babesia bovis T2Bo]|uniref:Vacuolar protein 14 C-terminal Fig4p binding family protein n=1 Tax=Babesia bovis T2Bo TaxID=484906 RepID=UPI001C346DB7|nr:Vacuolar protein 14 C-terminal Fig4p binding family protein [Babesia bovis T2Bo]EDO06722.2 Vacuolar protein 14 C-terminal Fig4p binding family protein [Babesia bovis T2Bo]
MYNMVDYNVAMSHEFLPKHTHEYLVDGNPEFRKRGRNAISQAVSNFLNDVEQTDNTNERCDEAVQRFVDVIVTHFMDNAISEYRIGGMIGLASAAIALDAHLNRHGDTFIKLVLPYFTDQDSTIFKAVQSLYNIIKKAKQASMRCFNDIFDGVCKLCCDEDEDVRQSSQFINRLLKEIIVEEGNHAVNQVVDLIASRLYVTNSHVSWINTINSLPEINILKHIPKVYVGLFNFLIDNNRDVRNAAEHCLKEFLALFKNALAAKSEIISDEMLNVILINMNRDEYVIKKTNIRWVKEMASLQPNVIHFDAFQLLLKSVIISIANHHGDVSECAQEANKYLFRMAKEQRSVANVEKVAHELVSILSNYRNQVVVLTVLQWIALLLELKPLIMNDIASTVSMTIVSCFKHSDSEIIMETIIRAIILVIGLGDEHFDLVSQQLLELFKRDEILLEDRGSRIIINVGTKVGFEKFYGVTSKCLERETDTNFLQRMVHSLNWTLLTAEETREMRMYLLTERGEDLGIQLQTCWEHNLAAALSLALWREKYDLASNIILRISKMHFHVEFWLWMDMVVQLLDSEVFMKMRLHLLQPLQHPRLLEALLGLSMILPQGETNKQLMQRLTISQATQIREQLMLLIPR